MTDISWWMAVVFVAAFVATVATTNASGYVLMLLASMAVAFYVVNVRRAHSH